MKPKQKNTVGFIVLGLIVYLVLILAVAHYCALAAADPEMNFLDALDALPMHMLLHPFTMVFDIKVIAIVTGVAAFIALYIATEVQVNQHDFAGAEHGSAKWNTDYKGYSKQYSSPFGKASNDGKDNMIMSQHVFLSMNSYKTQINNNVLVIGGSGSGKSRFIIKPNLLQANCSFVCTDPKGELVEACGDVLEKDGYRVVVFNLCDFEASNHYNPFAYVHSDDDIFKLVDCFWRNTTPSGSSKGDPFWDFSAQALLNAVCLYLYHATPKEDQNFTNVIRLLQLCKIDESKSDYKSVLDFMFDQFEQKCMDAAEDCGEPYVEDMAVGQYKIFRSAGQGKTAMSILITCQTRLRHFLSPKMKKFMGTDDIHLDEIGVNKTALFVVMSASDSTYNYIAAMMFSQLFDESFKIAREKYSGRLPIPVRLLLDEFANIGELPEFDKIIAIIRSIGMSATMGEFRDDAIHFRHEVVEDYAYISSEFGKLCDRLFGKNEETKKSNTDTLPAEITKKCEATVVQDAVQPFVKAAVKAKAVASYQSKMDRLLKQYKDYDTELRNLGTETANYKKCMEAIQSELNRQCGYVARIAEIERKQSDISDNPKAAEISKKVRDSYKTKRKEAESNIASLIDRAEQVVVLMQQDLENHIYDAKAQVETGKIDDMLTKLENSVQLDQEINGKAAKICLELKGIEPDNKG